MIPFGNDTVTLVRRVETVNPETGRTAVTYAREALTGCSWRRARRWQQAGETFLPVEAVVCRIPADQTRPAPGDLLILGDADVTVTSGAELQALIEQYGEGDGAIRVSSVRDNARPGFPLPHWAAS